MNFSQDLDFDLLQEDQEHIGDLRAENIPQANSEHNEHDEDDFDNHTFVDYRVVPLHSLDTKAKSSIKIDNLEIFFPHGTIHPPQRVYMEHVIKAIKENKNALLQSPTGTGKTMSLLCSALAWLRAFQEECRAKKQAEALLETKIIYATRTQSQVKQIVEQLKKTCYNPITCVLGSRIHNCIKNKNMEFKNDHGHPTILSRGQLLSACKFARSAWSQDPDSDTYDRLKEEYKCQYYQPFLDSRRIENLINQHKNTIRDIEDMVELGQNCGFCPYYYEKYLMKESDIIIMPYNYLLDPVSRGTNGMSLSNKIIIIDEAHNIENAAEDAASFDLTLKDLEHCKLEYFEIIRYFRMKRIQIKDIQLLFNILEGLEELMNYIKRSLISRNFKELTKQGREIFKVFHTILERHCPSLSQNRNNINVNRQNIEYIYETLCKAIEAFNVESNPKSIGALSRFFFLIQLLKKLYLRELDLREYPVENAHLENYIESYKVFYVIDEEDMFHLKLRCFNPAICFEEIKLQRPRTVILTSGTLEPFNSFELQLKLSFPIKLVNNHVIDPKRQCYTMIVPQGLQDPRVPIEFTFKNRENVNTYKEVALFLIALAKRVENGIVVVFASYILMDLCFYFWKNYLYESNITYFDKLNSIKPIFFEPREVYLLKETMTNYFINAQTRKGAILCCVCRGKVSEGIDFSDEKARAVVVIGVPLPSIKDVEVKAKIDYLHSLNNTQKKNISGDDWYRQQAIRAFNQAIGRVIRHKFDHGIVVLFERRYLNQFFNYLPNWIKDNAEVIYRYSDFTNKSKSFLDACKLLPKSEPMDQQPEEQENENLERNEDEEEQFEDLDPTQVIGTQILEQEFIEILDGVSQVNMDGLPTKTLCSQIFDEEPVFEEVKTDTQFSTSLLDNYTPEKKTSKTKRINFEQETQEHDEVKKTKKSNGTFFELKSLLERSKNLSQQLRSGSQSQSQFSGNFDNIPKKG